jgi:hypothetical protein
MSAGVANTTINILASGLRQSLVIEQTLIIAYTSVLNSRRRDINASIARNLGITTAGCATIRIDT